MIEVPLAFRTMADVPAADAAGSRPAAIRAAAAQLRRRLRGHGRVSAVRTIPAMTRSISAREALARPAAPLPPVTLVERMVLVRFEDSGGQTRTLVWEPRTAGDLPGAHAVQAALHRLGVAPEGVDLVAWGDLRAHDLRRVVGSVRAPEGAQQPAEPPFPAARFLVQARELAAARAPHPLRAAWYVPGGSEDLVEERLVALEGDVELGPGVALIATPGLTAGHQSLVIDTEDSLWVVSSNGVAVDCWQPLLSKIPGVRSAAEADGREVVLPATGVENALALYDSLLLERSLAEPARTDPRWLTILPDRELARAWKQWPNLPTYTHPGLNFGVL